MSDQAAIAFTVGAHVNRKVALLQRGYCERSGPYASRARGILAQLRRLGQSGGSLVECGELILDGWPSEKLAEAGASRRDEDRAFDVVKLAISLYALHQQSLARRCAVVYAADQESAEGHDLKRTGSFGCACRQIERDLDNASGVQRHMSVLETPIDFDRLAYEMRCLIGLMKNPRSGESILLDYGHLARDLYLIRVSPRARSRVISRWARDYYGAGAKAEASQNQSK